MSTGRTHRSWALHAVAALVAATAVALVVAPQVGDAREELDPVEEEQTLLDRHNEERERYDAAPLQRADDLDEIARNWSQRMADTQDLAHNGDLAGEACCWARLGENVGYTTNPSPGYRLHDAFYESEGHRRNLLNDQWDEVGVGAVFDGRRTWVTVVFRTENGYGGAPRVHVPGADRVDTAARVARQWGEDDEVAVIATAREYADALAAGPLAAELDGVLLLAEPDGLPDATADAIEARDIGEAVLVGGSSALGSQVITELEELGVTVTDRVAGGDRFATAAQIAEQLSASERVYVVEAQHPDPSRGWADAVSASALATYESAPVLGVRHGDVPEATIAALEHADPEEVVVVGGTAAVSDEVADELGRVAPVRRIAGANRYETSEKVAAELPDPSTVWLATGQNWPDALAAGAASGVRGQPTLLTSPDSTVAQSTVSTSSVVDGADMLYVLGGKSVMPHSALDAVLGN